MIAKSYTLPANFCPFKIDRSTKKQKINEREEMLILFADKVLFLFFSSTSPEREGVGLMICFVLQYEINCLLSEWPKY